MTDLICHHGGNLCTQSVPGHGGVGQVAGIEGATVDLHTACTKHTH